MVPLLSSKYKCYLYQTIIGFCNTTATGHKAAFGLLVSHYQPMAQRLATRVIGNGDLAQVLVQDAMLQAYLSLEKLMIMEIHLRIC